MVKKKDDTKKEIIYLGLVFFIIDLITFFAFVIYTRNYSNYNGTLTLLGEGLGRILGLVMLSTAVTVPIMLSLPVLNKITFTSTKERVKKSILTSIKSAFVFALIFAGVGAYFGSYAAAGAAHATGPGIIIVIPIFAAIAYFFSITATIIVNLITELIIYLKNKEEYHYVILILKHIFITGGIILLLICTIYTGTMLCLEQTGTYCNQEHNQDYGCLLKKALAKNDVSVCHPGSIDRQVKCTAGFAYKTKEDAACNSILQKDKCYQELALLKMDVSTCLNMKFSSDKCANQIIRQIELKKDDPLIYCTSITSNEAQIICLVSLAELPHDILLKDNDTVCESATNDYIKDNCYDKLAENDNDIYVSKSAIEDILLCQKIQNQVLKEICFFREFALAINYDQYSCSSQANKELHDFCFKVLANREKNLSLCEEINDPLLKKKCILEINTKMALEIKSILSENTLSSCKNYIGSEAKTRCINMRINQLISIKKESAITTEAFDYCGSEISQKACCQEVCNLMKTYKCYFWFALELKDVSFCVGSGSYFCYKEYAVATNDPGACKKSPDFNNCLLNAAADTKNKDWCNLIGDAYKEACLFYTNPSNFESK